MGVGALALVLRALTLGRFQTVDETLWMTRTARFSDAMLNFRFEDASASVGQLATMPGITTMWAGSVGRAVWTVGRDLGFWSEKSVAFGQTRSSIALAQGSMALLLAVTIGLLTWLVAAWIGRRAGVVAGVLIASEPFLVAHGSVLHTDEPMTLFGLASMVGTALLLGVPRHSPFRHRRGIALASGALFALSALSKISAVMFLTSVGLIGLWAVVRDARAGTPLRHVAMVMMRLAGWWLVAATVVVVVLYPALWADPGDQLEALWRAAEMGRGGHRQFFLGEVTPTPGPLFYLVAVPMRMTPWLLVLAVVAVAVGVLHRATRAFLVAAAIMVVPSFVVLSFASKQFDRYALIVPSVLAVVVGVVAEACMPTIQGRLHLSSSRMAGVGAAAIAAAAIHSAVVAPWGLAYFNPMLGGSRVAEDNLLVGWGEGLELAGGVIEDRESHRCHEVTIRSTYPIPSAFPCGVTISSDTDAEYVVIYVTYRQRATDAEIDSLIGDRDLVARVHVRGMEYASVYQRADASAQR